jgi:hypothetical protein
MKFRNTINELMQFILGAVSRIFSPTDDHYPATGAQPFEGDIKPNRPHDW